MTVQFDEARLMWRVVNKDGVVIRDGFASDASAWKWADAHSDTRLKNGAPRLFVHSVALARPFS